MRLSSLHLPLAAAAICVALASPALAQTFPIKWSSHQSSYFRGVGPIVLPTYHLTFITSKEATAVGGFGARARLTKSLAGVDEATLRRLTDEAYADLGAQFTAAGFTVVSPEKTREIVVQGGIQLQPGNVSTAQAGQGIVVNSAVSNGHAMFGPSAAPALAPFRPGSNPMSWTAQYPKLIAGQPQNTLAVLPYLVLDFGNLGGKASSGWGRQTATVAGDLAFTVRGVQSGLIVVKAIDRGRAFPAFIRPENEPSVSTVFATQVAGGADVRPLQIGTDNLTRGDAVVLDLPVWERLVRQAFKDYNAAIVAAVVKGRG
ncbi:MAG: hypothetical protein V4466_16315 [Pseudomonadota bacterium]